MFEDSDNPVRPKNYQTIQWPLNQAAYQNLANDQVDWAALAQQWIQMKETFPPEFVPAAPPPPLVTFKDFEEKGEAPMEVDKEEEAPPAPIISGINTQSGNWNSGWSSFPNQTQWRTNYNTNKEYGSDDKDTKSVKPFNQIGSGWSSWSNSSTKITPTPLLTASRQPLLQAPTVPSFTAFNNSNNFASVPLESDPYWMHKTKLPETLDNNIKELPSNFSDTDTKNDDLTDQDESAQTLDNAKRKLLPAWIREGLEKMEREKLKEEEKERELKEKELLLQQRRKEEEEILKELEREKRTKSRFESDSEEDLVDRPKPGTSHSKYSGFKEKETKREPSPQKLKPYRTKEEQIQDIMLTVRKTLTEILLDVTNEEILDIAKQTVTKSRRKAPTAQALRKTALTSLTGGLGLGIYGDSSGESSDSDNDTKKVTDNKDDKEIDDIDSDAELEEIIKRRKAAFEKTSREIEAQIAEEEEREERRRRDRGNTNTGGPSGNRNNKTDSDDDSDNDTTYNNNNKRSHDNNDQFVKKRDGETQLLDKNYSKSGWSMRDKKPSRFSDPRDTVRNTHLTHVSIVSSDQVGSKRMDNDGGGPSSSSGNNHHNHKSGRNKTRDKSSQSSDDTTIALNKRKSKKQYKTTSSSNSKNKKLSRSSNEESNEEDLTDPKSKNNRATDSVSSSKRSSRSTDRSIKRSRSRDSKIKESRSRNKRSQSRSDERYRSRSRDRYTKRMTSTSNKSYRDRSRSRERHRYKSRSRSYSRDRSYSRSSYSRKNKSRERERSKSKSRDRKASKYTKESK